MDSEREFFSNLNIVFWLIFFQGENHWKWAKILDAGVDDGPGDDPICLAYLKDRLAVSFPNLGVKVWAWCKGELFFCFRCHKDVIVFLVLIFRYMAASTVNRTARCYFNQVY